MNIFLNLRDLEFKIDPRPLQIFKIIVLVTVALQIVAFFLDSSLIFSDQGLFPSSLAQSFQSTLYAPFLKNGNLICSWILLFAGLAFWKPTQTVGFLGIFAGEFFLNRRVFPFTDFGDTGILFFSLMLALTLPQHLHKKESSICIYDIIPLSVLSTIIYAINFLGKIKSAWADGSGLDMSLSHVDLLRIPALHLPHSLSLFLNYSAIFCVLTLAIGSLISPKKRGLRNGIIIAGFLYHGVSNLIFHLDWSSLPYLGLFIALWINSAGLQNEVVPIPKTSSAKIYTALTILFLAFFNMKNSDDFAFFTERGFPIGHNWYMFAPPAQHNLIWKASLQLPDEKEEVIPLDKIPDALNFFSFQHRYKYLHNLRKPELIPMTKVLTTRLCLILKKSRPDLQKVYLIRETTDNQSKETFNVLYPPEDCP